MKVLVLGVNRYDFEGKDGKRVQGGKLRYITETRAQGDNRSGFDVYEISLKADQLPAVHTVPGWYDSEWTQRPGQDGRPQSVLAQLRFAATVDLSPVSTTRGTSSGNGATAGPALAGVGARG